ncbi:MAG: F0F1 ATP synthase subunit A [Candidatus Eisenbacteria bacterium]
MDHAFLRRVRTATIVLGLLGSLFVTLYAGVKPGLGWTAGAGVALANFILLHWILVRVLRPQPMLGPKVYAALGAKLPLIFGSVFLAVGVAKLPLLWFSLGFSLLFVVVLLKVLGQLLVAKQGLTIGDPREGAAFRMRRQPNGPMSTKSKIGAALLFVGLSAAAPQLPRIVAHFDQASWTTDLAVESMPAAQAAEDAHGTDAHATDAHAADSHAATDAHGGDAHVAGDAHGGDAHAAAGDHGEGHGEDHGAVKHFPNLVTYITWIATKAGVSEDTTWLKLLNEYENVFFNILLAIFFAVVTSKASRARAMIPGKLQNTVEYAVESLYEFVKGILGHEARRYIPFIGALFFYIWGMNWMGLIPGFKSPTAYLNTTLALAGCTFLYVQYTGITRLGPLGWLHHLSGSPNDPVGWAMVPLMLPLEIIGEIAKPVSLSLRLFGNVMGEDTLLALFATLITIGIPALGLHVGVPLHIPFMFLALLASTIQALVFTLLATIYISQMLPHEDH